MDKRTEKNAKHGAQDKRVDTDKVVVALKKDGIDTDAAGLIQAVKFGKIAPSPACGKRGYLWSDADIARAHRAMTKPKSAEKTDEKA